ncbi:MAG: pyridoxamine 5'-phosphate oxidase family protein [Ruminiclostridium sp.]|jgi:nitroimidazol reductase NimA-like FMN-containing flavoprotein (pyridoxamine 5'-phosphate oxidase superfamily)|nr:pyridoxamine 5'-phosphate oxidase family protein [Ruminiclostridium sp.]
MSAFRPLRRKDRAVSPEAAWALLEKGHYGTLAVTGDDGFPYAVPINYVLVDGEICLHTGKQGYLLDCIRRDRRVCFSVVPMARLIPEHVTEVYESVLVFGEARVAEDPQDRQKILRALTFRLGTAPQDIGEAYLEKNGPRTTLIRIKPLHISGKSHPSYVPIEERLKQ